MRIDRVDFGSRKGLFPARRDKALCREVIDLIRLRNAHCRDQRNDVRHIRVDEVDLIAQMCDIAVIDHALAAHDAVNLIALFEQQFCKIRSVLTGDTGDQCMFHGDISFG